MNIRRPDSSPRGRPFQKGPDPRRKPPQPKQRGAKDHHLPRVSIKAAFRALWERDLPPEIASGSQYAQRKDRHERRKYGQYLAEQAIEKGLKNPLMAPAILNLAAKLFDQMDQQTGGGTTIIFNSSVNPAKLRAAPKSESDSERGKP